MSQASSGLKPFQSATVEHVYKRLYTDTDHATHFLVADEVGLGKTLVAQGVIAKAVSHLRQKGTKRINIVYLCSNQSIATQNLRKLRKALPEGASMTPQTADRMTLLALGIDDIEESEKKTSGQVNFFPLTPGTSFKMGNSMGKQEERRFLYHFLASAYHGNNAFMRETARGLPGKSLMRMLKGLVSKPDAQWYEEIEQDAKAKAAVSRLGVSSIILGDLKEQIAELANEYPTHWKTTPSQELQSRARGLVKQLRLRIASASIQLLEPSLIIMDEFQRFTELLDGRENNVVSLLVQKLTSYRNGSTNEEVRMLLLSATPYRYLTLDNDGQHSDAAHLSPIPSDDQQASVGQPATTRTHREDFGGTLRILFRGRPEIAEEIERELARLRRAMMGLPKTYAEGCSARANVQEKLLRAITRTERVDTLHERNSMVDETLAAVDLQPSDVEDAQLLLRLTRQIGTRSPIEFWKSAPYLLNFMNGYKLVSEIEKSRDAGGPSGKPVLKLLKALAERSLRVSELNSYDKVDPRNGRLRALANYAFEGRDGTEVELGQQPLAGRVWMPPTLPYHHCPKLKDVDPQALPQPYAVSKALVFSDWQVVPDTIAAILSYEAERRTSLKDRPYKDYKKAPGIDDATPSILNYASPTLAEMIDPLAMCYGPDRLTSLEAQRRYIANKLRKTFHTRRRSKTQKMSAAEQIWQAVLDKDNCTDGPNLFAARNIHVTDGDARAFRLMADFCLGGPATCALRALLRVTDKDVYSLRPAATEIGASIIRLLTRPINAAHILSEKPNDAASTWVKAIRYAAVHDLQSVLDEWFHMLANDAWNGSSVDPELIAQAVNEALSLNPSEIAVRDVQDWSKPRTGKGKLEKKFLIRGYFAMRLANASGEDGDSGNRVGNVKNAFCSPFAPFVLASTSVGQEGLDFHPYCHRVYHWNVPTNPVDLEQREGRVHRFKGHALRLNLAAAYANSLCSRLNGSRPTDPWVEMFNAAEVSLNSELQKGEVADGRAPAWVLPGQYRVRRIALNLPFSTEGQSYRKVRTDLTLYRLAFGQVRQDDLMAHLRDLHVAEDLSSDMTNQLQITLRPKQLPNAPIIVQEPFVDL